MLTVCELGKIMRCLSIKKFSRGLKIQTNKKQEEWSSEKEKINQLVWRNVLHVSQLLNSPPFLKSIDAGNGKYVFLES